MLQSGRKHVLEWGTIRVSLELECRDLEGGFVYLVGIGVVEGMVGQDKDLE